MGKNFKVIGINKKTKQKIIVLSDLTEEKATKFCEEWGWTYDDGNDSFWLEIE